MTGSHYQASQSRDRVTSLRANLVSLRLSVVSWATLERQVLPVGQDLVKGQVTSGWTMSTVVGVSPPWPHAASMVGESITVLTMRMQGLSVQVSKWTLDTVSAFVFPLFFPLSFLLLHLFPLSFSFDISLLFFFCLEANCISSGKKQCTIFKYHSLAKKGPLRKERPPPTFGPNRVKVYPNERPPWSKLRVEFEKHGLEHCVYLR